MMPQCCSYGLFHHQPCISLVNGYMRVMHVSLVLYIAGCEHRVLTLLSVYYAVNLQSKLTTLTQTADDLAYTQQWQRQDYGAQKSSEIERSTQVRRSN